MMHAHLSALREANERLDILSVRILNCADAFNGSQPQEAIPEKNQTVGHSLNSQFQDQIQTIHRKIGFILSQISRIEDEVLDGPKATDSSIGRSSVERAY